MKRATITETKNRLSALLDQVKAGETIEITDRGIPVARLIPAVSGDRDGDEGRLARLERAGIIQRGSGSRLDIERIKRPFPSGSPNPSGVLDQLLKDRREGR